MKKFISLILALAITVSLCACSKPSSTITQETAAPVQDSKLLIGYAKAEITPESSVPLNGVGSSASRMSQSVKDDLYVTCLAISDGTTTSLLYSQDLLTSTAVLTPTLRSEISAATKVLSDHIFIAATATYSAPDMKSTHENMTPFMEKYKAALVSTAQEALADMAPSRLYYSTTEVEGLSFNDQYIMADGTVEDGRYGFFDREISGHAAEPDRTMRLVKIERKDKTAILMVNWQCRPILTANEDKTAISADFIGYMRDKVEADTGMLCVYFSGALGDIAPTSLIESEQHGLDVKAYGEKVAEYAVAGSQFMEFLEGETTGAWPANHTCTVNHDEEDMVDLAKQVTAERKKKGNLAADKLAKELGFRSVYHAADIVSRPSRNKKETFELSALRIAGLGVMMFPMQIFSDVGVKTLEMNPTEFAFVLGQSNAAWYIIPSEASFAYGGYDVDTSYFAKGSGEKMGKLLAEMILMTTD